MENIIAFASNRKEFDGVLKFAAKKPNVIIKCICLEFWPGQRIFAKNIKVFEETDLVSDRELYFINKKALFFSRNWYKFDKKIEQASTMKEISLGFVSDFAIYNLFRQTFLAINSGINAAKCEKTKTFIGIKDSFSSDCAKAVAKATSARFKEIEIEQPLEKKRKLNFNKKKIADFQKKVFSILKEKIIIKNGADIVFVKSNGYLDRFSKEVEKNNSFSVSSLDNFVVRKILMPWNAKRFVKTKKEKRIFFKGLFKELSEKSKFRKKMVFNDINFADVFFKFMPRFSERDWPEFVFLIEMLLKEFKEKKPCAVVVWEDWIPFERICVLLAKKINAKSVVVQHGLFSANTNQPDFIRGFAPVVADKIAVWGPHYKKNLEKKMVPGKKISITGSPRFDVLYNKKTNGYSFRKSIGVSKKEKLVVLVTQPVEKNKVLPIEIASAAMEAVKEIKNTKLVIKIHAFENKKDYAKIITNSKGKAILLNKTDLHRLINCADAVIAISPIIGLEAMALKKPTAIYRKTKDQTLFEGIKRITGKKDNFKKSIQKFLKEKDNKKAHEKKVAKFLYEFGFKQDGKATERIIRLLK